LELGCGLGAVGVVLSRVGAARVLCTDGDSQTVANCTLNVGTHGVHANWPGGVDGHSALEVKQLHWEDGWKEENGVDVVLGADLLYDPGHIRPLMGILKEVLHASAAQRKGLSGLAVEGDGSMVKQPEPVAYIATTLRNESTMQQWIDAVAADGELQLEDVTGAAGASSGWSGGIRFCHLLSLEDARPRIFLHKVSLFAPPALVTCSEPYNV